MLSIADKIIKLASILVNNALGGNKQRHQQKTGWWFADTAGPFHQRAQKKAGHAVDWILEGVLGSPHWGVDYKPYKPQGRPPKPLGRSAHITNGHLHVPAPNMSWTPMEN